MGVNVVSFELPADAEEEVKQAIAEVVANHPLDEAYILQEHLTMAIVPVRDWPSVGLCVNAEEYPHLVLTVGTDRYFAEGGLKTEDLRRDLYHEFTHLIDRQNPAFAITPDKEARAKQLTLGSWKFNAVVDLWNVSINGRLHRRGIDIESADELKRKRFGGLLSNGALSQDDLAPIDKAWDLEQPRYDNLIELASSLKKAVDKCLPQE